jgi:hypothetical protein
MYLSTLPIIAICHHNFAAISSIHGRVAQLTQEKGAKIENASGG